MAEQGRDAQGEGLARAMTVLRTSQSLVHTTHHHGDSLRLTAHLPSHHHLGTPSPAMEVKTVPADALFRVYTACPGDVRTLVLDVRGSKEFSKKHLIGSYCIRLSANGRVLLVRGLGGWGVRLGDCRQLGTLAGTRVTAGGVGDDGCGTASNRTASRTCWAKRRRMVNLTYPHAPPVVAGLLQEPV